MWGVPVEGAGVCELGRETGFWTLLNWGDKTQLEAIFREDK